MELSPALRRIRDFYFKQALAAPADVTHVHGASLVFDAAPGGGLVVTVRFADDGASPQGANAR